MFEEKYIAQYGLQKNQIELISGKTKSRTSGTFFLTETLNLVDICDILIDMFKQNVHCLKELAMDKNSASLDDETGKSIGSRQTMSKNKLVEAATVLLDTLKNDSSHKET
jgi:hypothetical protein